MSNKTLRHRLSQLYGKPARIHYHEGDMTGIASYHQCRLEQGVDGFVIDDVTWHDLAMEDVFKQVNCTQSTSGEQVLYHLLRTPLQDAESHRSRARLIRRMGRDHRLRLDIQVILTRLGKNRNAVLTRIFAPERRGPAGLITALILVAGLLASALALALGWRQAAVFFVLLLLVNPIYRLVKIRELEGDLPTVNYSAAVVKACLKIEKAVSPGDSGLGEAFQTFFQAGHRTAAVARLGGITSVSGNDVMQMLNGFFLMDLIGYELLKNRLARHHEDIMLIHHQLGLLDAAIAVSSWRESLPLWCEPHITFDPAASAFMKASDLCHPLVDEPVPNPLDTTRPILLTGSNASGKSTFLKAAALSAVLSQTVATALAVAYQASSFRIYTSMAISDDIRLGESYFIVEIKSLKRIVDAAQSNGRVFCVIDEILRGTNTVERIAASSRLLLQLAESKVLCLAATHDIELCTLLEGVYDLLHFEERVTAGGITFDYRIKPGPATSRNAIKLLELMGFDPVLVSRADSLAREYLETGLWAKEDKL